MCPHCHRAWNARQHHVRHGYRTLDGDAHRRIAAERCAQTSSVDVYARVFATQPFPLQLLIDEPRGSSASVCGVAGHGDGPGGIARDRIEIMLGHDDAREDDDEPDEQHEPRDNHGGFYRWCKTSLTAHALIMAGDGVQLEYPLSLIHI